MTPVNVQQKSASMSDKERKFGFLNEIPVLFKIVPVHAIKLHVFDSNGEPTMVFYLLR